MRCVKTERSARVNVCYIYASLWRLRSSCAVCCMTVTRLDVFRSRSIHIMYINMYVYICHSRPTVAVGEPDRRHTRPSLRSRTIPPRFIVIMHRSLIFVVTVLPSKLSVLRTGRPSTLPVYDGSRFRANHLQGMCISIVFSVCVFVFYPICNYRPC